MDSFGRTIDYLRVSVTARCNERCLYCMPQGCGAWGRAADELSAAELERIARAAAGLGVRKFRLTGGEPLARGDAVEIVRRLSAVPGVEGLGLSTNGTRLARLAGPLRAAGLRTVNISLDALDAGLYRRITGGEVGAVLRGIRAAVEAGFERIKLNCVLMRGWNEQEIWPLTLFAAEHGLPLRLIELMPMSAAGTLGPASFLAAGEAMRLLEERDELVAQPDRRMGWGPARYYLLRHTGALVGFIGALTTPHFCDTCNKLRLTADGRVRPCLGHAGELDLRSALRGPDPETALRALLLRAMRLKPASHDFLGAYEPCRPMTAIGG